MSTTTNLPANRYPATCAKCFTWVEANAGVRYRLWPFHSDQPWLVRCADDQTCVDNLAARREERRRQDPNFERNEHHRINREAERDAKAARLALPKTIKFYCPEYDSDHVMTRRKTKTGYTVRWAATSRTTGETESLVQRCSNETDAILFQHDTLHDPYMKYVAA